MDSFRLDRLTDDQKACLRLLFANLSIKDIGRELDVSPNTVKGRLMSARRLLGANRSMQAAVMLVRYERDTLGVDPPRSLGLERQLIEQGAAATPEFSATVVRNRFSAGMLSRLALIFVIAASAMMLAGAAVADVQGLTHLFWAYRIDISDYPYR